MAKTPQGIDRFITEYIKSDNASAAYRIAFPKSLKWKDKTVHNRASELLNSGEVQGRLKELEQELKEETLMTAKQAYEKYERIFDKGLEIEQLSPAKGAVDSQAKLCGLLVDKQDITSDGEKIGNTVVWMTRDEMKEEK